jgi:3',5'-cyclic AMP phosphodiesterase CpdA
MKKKIITKGLLFIFAAAGLYAAEESNQPTRRLGLFIGANNGGRDRVILRYAVSDAKSVSGIFSVMGGIASEDNIILVEPSVREINRQFDNFEKIAAQSRRNAQRTELIFYYSGHSDENGIFLYRDRYGYRELRERINSVQADMRIVIMDSCSSGAMTRIKGGVKTQPFLFDSSVSAEGYAILTSSSADEVSQESDNIESSYFTHSLLAGLRGAADSVGDGRVTLNELYRFAYTETLARTETSAYGAQHPSYDIQITGSGDVVLTDIRETSASLLIAENITGRISIRDSSDFLVAELTKVTVKPVELGLEPGLYTIILQRGDNFYRASVTLEEKKRTVLSIDSFSVIAAAPAGRNRGDIQGIEAQEDVPLIPFEIQFIPGFNTIGASFKKATNNLFIGIFGGMGGNVEGIAVSQIFLINNGYIQGIQASGIANSASGNIRGIQASGISNFTTGNILGVQASGITNFTTGNILGVQASGITNVAAGEMKGLQSSGIVNIAGKIDGLQAAGILNINGGGKGVMMGLVNISTSEDVIPIGLVNIVKNGILHPAVYVDDMLFTNLSFRSGNKYFYAVFSAGFNPSLGGIDIGSQHLITRGGIGFELPINKAFIDIDLTSGNFYSFDAFRNINVYQARLTGGFKFMRHLGVFAGVSFDFFKKMDNEPYPEVIAGSSLKNSWAAGSIGGGIYRTGFFAGIQF